MSKEQIAFWRNRLMKFEGNFYLLDEKNWVSKIEVPKVTPEMDDEEIEEIVQELNERIPDGSHLFGCAGADFSLAQFFREDEEGGALELMKRPQKPVRPNLYPPKEVKKPSNLFFKRVFGGLNNKWKDEAEEYDRYRKRLDSYNEKVKKLSPDEHRKHGMAMRAYEQELGNWEKTTEYLFYQRLDKNSAEIWRNYRNASENPKRERVIRMKQEMREEIKKISGAFERTNEIFEEAWKTLQPDPNDNWENAQKAAEKKDPVFHRLSLTRHAGHDLCAGLLLSQGLSIEEILDPTQHLEKKKAVVDLVRTKLEAGEITWVANSMYEAMSIASEQLEKRLLDLQGRVPAYTEDDVWKEYPELRMLGGIAHDLNQEIDRAEMRRILSDKNNQGGVPVQVANDGKNKAELLSGIMKAFEEGFQGRQLCYQNALGKGSDAAHGILPGVMHLDYVQNQFLNMFADDAKKHGGHVSPEFAKEHCMVLAGFVTVVGMNEAASDYMEKTYAFPDNLPKTQVAFWPLANAIYHKNLPKVTDYKLGEFTKMEGMEKLVKETKDSMVKYEQSKRRVKLKEQKELFRQGNVEDAMNMQKNELKF